MRYYKLLRGTIGYRGVCEDIGVLEKPGALQGTGRYHKVLWGAGGYGEVLQGTGVNFGALLGTRGTAPYCRVL